MKPRYPAGFFYLQRVSFPPEYGNMASSLLSLLQKRRDGTALQIQASYLPHQLRIYGQQLRSGRQNHSGFQFLAACSWLPPCGEVGRGPASSLLSLLRKRRDGSVLQIQASYLPYQLQIDGQQLRSGGQKHSSFQSLAACSWLLLTTSALNLWSAIAKWPTKS